MADINNDNETVETGLEIAVIGMAGRFPGARDINEFWNNLKNGVEAITFFSTQELAEAGCDPRLLNDPRYVKAMGYLPDLEYFDGAFFGYTPMESEITDPQVRIMHECAWEALEDAGYDPGSTSGRIGFYSGGESSSLWETLTSYSPLAQYIDPLVLGNLNNKDYLSTRISYKFNLRGPAFTIHTACSTSLVAIHLAVQGLLNGECEMALAGGIRVTPTGKSGYLYQEGMISSPDGHCRAFDARAKGTVAGDGAGLVVLKSLEEARADNDHIYAIIKGTAINNDGVRKVGYHAPSIDGQSEVISAALYTAEVEPGTIGYIETHGTGTELGDTVEIEALKLCFNKTNEKICALGSVKTNVGHLGCAAGVTGFIKTVLILNHRLIPPSLHFEKPNPKIDFENSPFYVNTHLRAWQPRGNGFPFRAGVSSFGIGGTNAHIILEAVSVNTLPKEEAPDRPYKLFLLSARTTNALEKIRQNLADYLKANTAISLADAAYTLQVGRKRFPVREKILCRDTHEAIQLLTGKSSPYKAQPADENREVIFMFPGLGPQYVDMGKDLYQTEPFFREEMDRCFEIAQALGYNIKEILYNNRSYGSYRTYIIDRTNIIFEIEIAQMVMFSFEYALAKLVMHWGIKPHAMIGYSFGEYVAACLAGVFSLEDILRLLAARGKMISRLPRGTMLSVPLPVKQVLSLLPVHLSLAIDNGESCVVSGAAADIESFAQKMKEKKILASTFESPYAAHSQMLEAILPEFTKEMAKIQLHEPEIPYISTVTGNWITVDDAQSPGYWARQLRSTVYFVQGIRKILGDVEPPPVFLEMGPGRDMSALVNRETEEKKAINLVKHRGVQKETGDDYYLLDKLGRLWLYGVPIDWQAFHDNHPDHKPYRVSLPKYSFERQRHWQIIDDLKAGKYIFQQAVTALNAPGNGESGFNQPLEKQPGDYKTVRYERPQLSTYYAAPQDDAQQALVRIWQHVFGIEEIGIKDDFFELGGDSLKAIHVLAMLHKETNRQVPLDYFFDHPTIEQVAAYDDGKETVFVAIQPLEKKEYYRLSSAQKRMYFFQQVDPGSIAYNNVLANVIEGDIDTEKLSALFKKLIHRHDSLRTSFIEVNGEVVQHVHDHVEFEILATDTLPQHGQTQTFIRPFDLSRAPLLRVGLINRLLIVDMHHIISDGTSLALLIEEFMRLYQGEELPFLRLQYKDYAEWQNRETTRGALAVQQEYWLNEFSGDIPVLDLPYDYIRPELRTFAGKVLAFEIAADETQALNRLASGCGVTLYMLLLAVTNIFLARLSGQETVVVGTPTAGRTHADLERIIGMFVNTLALKQDVKGEKTTHEFLNEVKEKTLRAFANQQYQYEELVEHLQVDRSSGRNPLFDTLFALQNVEIRGLTIPDATIKDTGLKVKPFPFEQNIVKFDLSIECFERGDILSFNMEYGTELFKDETAARFAAYFKKIISSVVENPDDKIAAIEIISEQEKEQLLFQFNDTAAAYPQDKTIPQLFVEQAGKIPDYVAVFGHGQTRTEKQEEKKRRREEEKNSGVETLRATSLQQIQQITYYQLNEQSNRLAALLIEKGVQPDTIVGIMMKRSIEMITGILGILKAGGAYLPIDPEYPQERIDYMLKDSGAKILLTGDENKKTMNCQLSIVNSQLSMREKQLAYVIYTSGSTGKPKGVLIDHWAVVNRLYFIKDHYGLDEHDVILQKTTFTFDVSVCELFRWILPGARLCLLPLEFENQPEKMLDFMVKHKVTTIDFVPSALTVFLELMTLNCPALRWVFIGAEVVRPTLVSAFTRALGSRCHAQLINAYGPTEAVVDVTYFNCTGSESLPVIPIGKPMANVQLFILDKYYLQLQPAGVPGELCIAGRSLARGYLNNPELTNDRFITRGTFEKAPLDPPKLLINSHLPLTTHHSPIYKTGDLARWLADGNIEFLGRIDQQVKIRGFRVELGEIENRLLNISGIKETFVLPREETPGDIYLCAYFVSNRDYEITELREHLAGQLPGYMIPAFFVRLEKFPLTPAGKIDRRALPQPELEYTAGYTAPRNEIERKLVKLWTEILGKDSLIGINDNFFQLGGHSLKATTLMSKIHKELEVKIGLMEIFKTPTIREIAHLIQGVKKESFHAVEPIEKKEYYPLHSAQKRLYFLQQLDLHSTGYNMPLVLPLGKEIKRDKLEFALQHLIARHESLRTSFERINEEVVQRVHDQVAFEVEYKNLSTDYTNYTDYTDGRGAPPWSPEIIKKFIRPFDLAKAPLMRSGLIAMPDGDYIWIVDIHHIVSDGTSQNILTRDFIHFYDNGLPLAPLPIQYKDFAHWQNTLFAGDQVKSQGDYWLQLYAGEIPRLNLPADYKRPEVFTFAGDQYQYKIEKQEATAFKALGARFGGTLYMNMLATLNTLFYKYGNQSDIIIGTGIAGRRHADIQEVVGMFVNTLAMRNYPASEKTYEQFLQEVIANSVKGFENQDVQFEELVEKLEPERDPSRNPLFDVSMVVQNFQELPGNENAALPAVNTPNTPNTQNTPAVDYKNRTSKFDLTFFISEAAGDIYIDIEYYTGIFKEETITRLVEHLKNVITIIIKNPGVMLKDIDVLSQKEKEQLLYEFNDTGAEFPGENTVHELIGEQVGRTPDYISLLYKNHRITYQELEKQANGIARYLSQKKKISIEEPVGVWMSEPLFRQVALLGILQAGGAFIPIDPATPLERIQYIINDAHIGVIISEKQYVRELNRLQWECPNFHSYLCIDSFNIHREIEAEKNQLMDEELWHHVGENAIDEITGGGWLSSYTGLPISRAEMDEYGDNILKKLTPLLHRKMKVLEIGCASGISMYRIAPKVGFYYGTDLSDVIINTNKEKVREKGLQNIELSCLAAHEIDQVQGKAGNGFDLVIINSVIQCFHGHNYLRSVLQKAIALLGNNGYLFIGDVMDQERKNALVQDLTAFKEANKEKGYTTKTDFSAELFVSKGFWQDLEAEWDEIEGVTCSDKLYTIANELTKFRYDVLVKINKTGKVRNDGRKKIKYQDDLRMIDQENAFKSVTNIYPGNLAYIIYTSGSTGKPKGVMITHRSLVNLCSWHNTYYGVKPQDRATRYAGFSFDASIWEFFPYLLVGASVCMVPEEIKLDIGELNSYYEKNNVTVSFLPTQVYEQFSTLENRSLRILVTGGDKLRNYRERNYRLYNNYGPTENTVVTTSYWVTENTGNIPIGKPIANNQIYIFDKNSACVPVGIPGELQIGGDGIARGYLNNPELTAERFNRSYWSYRTNIFYKTGDLARWLNCGNIEFLGRIDQQVKIRGFRIELGEIETRLLKHDSIKDSVVIERTENGETYICAYVVPRIAELVDTAELSSYLSRFLPDYMIPKHFIKVNRIPLTVSGKIDRKALPLPHFIIPADYIPPANTVEDKLAFLWSEVLTLDKEKISMNANFFQLGGHSLKATALVAKVHKELNVKIPLVEIFKSSTIRELAKYIEAMDRDLHIAIEPVEKREYYVSSSAQKRMYFLQQFDVNGIGYNMPMVLPLGKEIEKDKLESTLRKLIDRHESLRTSFEKVNEEVVQRIHQRVEFEIDELGVGNDRIAKFIRPFDLAKAPLMRSALMKLPDGTYTWVVDMHHIISDGTSHAILSEDFTALYNDKKLKPLAIQYKDFSAWQQLQLESGEIKAQMAYWLDLFAGEIPRLNLPLDYKRPPVFTFAGDTYGFRLPGEETNKFNELGSRESGTLYMNLLAVLNILFYKYTAQTDIIIGSGIAGRRHADLQGIVGMFINSLAMRNYPIGDKTYEYFLQEVINTSVKGFDNQDVQFEDLVDNLELERDASRNPVFDVMMTVQNFHSTETAGKTAGDSKADENSAFAYQNPTSKFDLTFFVDEQGDDIFINIEYYTAIFKPETIQRMACHFKNIIKTVSAGSHLKLKDIGMITDAEKQQILFEFNNTKKEYPGNKTIHQLFAEQVEKTPDFIAVIGHGRTRTDTDNINHVETLRATSLKQIQQITYHQLNEQSNRLAGLLIKKGILADSIIGIMMERSIELITGILGILKSGGAYLPIDPESPQDRIQYMLKDSNARIMIEKVEEQKSGRAEKDFLASDPSSLAYIIYTSGSTGKPKGVPIRHTNISPLLHWGYDHLGIGTNDRTLQNLAYYFDWSVWEIFITLTTGAVLYIVPDDLLLNLGESIPFLKKNDITILHATPAQYQHLISSGTEFETFKYLFLGAEKLTINLLTHSFASVPGDCRVFNMYGPTEATIISAVLEIKRGEEHKFVDLSSIPIGKPVANSAAYIIDKYDHLQPIGIAGELLIRGEGVARGYLNNPELTAQKFSRNYWSYGSYRTYINYKSGDLARWLTDGNIEFLGRIDSQVKIRGFRIELGEIENQLAKHEQIKEAVVLVHTDEREDKYLCAYIVPGKEEVEIAELKEYLSGRLPAYMVPAYFVQLEKIPVTPNGKLDRKALPLPGREDPDIYVAPVNEIENQLVTIWAEILHLDKNKISTHDNFFNIGGHSLKATSLTAMIHKEFNVKIPQADVFLNPTVKGLANYIGKAVRTSYDSIEPVEKKEYYVLSSNQKRLYILQQVNPLGTAYNMPQIIPLAAGYNFEKLAQTFNRLIKRHENLRISFQTIHDRPVQKVHEPGEVEFQLEYYEDASLNRVMGRFVRPFDLGQPSFLRAGIFTCTGQDNMPPVLLVDIHHIISDAVSQDILTRDFLFFYQQADTAESIDTVLPPLRIQYKDFSEWQNSPAQLLHIKQQEAYWLQIFEEEISSLKLPYDFPRPEFQDFAGDTVHFTMEKLLLKEVASFASRQGLTMYMMFLALFNVLLARLCGQDDIVIGTASAGRRHADLEKIIGMFVNTLAFRNFPHPEKSFSDFLQEVKQRTLAAFENQDYPFEDLVDKVIPDRNINRNPLFDVMFNFLEQDKTDETPRAGIGRGIENELMGPHAPEPEPANTNFEHEVNASKFDMTFTISKIGLDNFHFNIRYRTQLLKKETVQDIAGAFKEIVANVMVNPNIKIAEIKISSQSNINLERESTWADSCAELENE